MANSNLTELYYIEESTYGVTPATPAWVYLRKESISLELVKTVIDNPEITGVAQEKCQKHGQVSVTGDIVTSLIYEEIDPFLESLMADTWTADVLTIDPTNTAPKSFSILEYNPTLTGSEKYKLYTGVRPISVASSFAPDAQIPITMTMLGLNMTASASAPAGSTGLDGAPENSWCPMNANSGTLNEGGAESTIVTGFDWTLARNITNKYGVGSEVAYAQSLGNWTLTGTLTAFFDSMAQYLKFVNETESSLDYTPTDAAGNTYKFDIPRIKYNSGSVDRSADTEMPLSMDVKALYDGTKLSLIEITRTTA